MKSRIDELEAIIKIKSDENELLNEKNKALKQKNECLEDILESIRTEKIPEDVCDRSYFSDKQYEKNKLIEGHQDQHQQDCIRINDLTTTVHVLAGLYSTLRKNMGMD